MFFLIAMLIVGLSCLIITYKTLVGYGNFPLWLRLTVLLLLAAAWFCPLLLRVLRNMEWMSGTAYAVTAKVAYFLMGFAFVLFMLLLLRDIVWYAVYFISRNPDLNPGNTALLNRYNIITLLAALALSFYGVYEAHKTPAVKELVFADSRIKENVNLVLASDLHIDRSTPLWQIRQIVDKINSLHPDYILLAGDIGDDFPGNLQPQMNELQKLKAKKIYVSLGNHEFYNNHAQWMINFVQMGFDILHNSGEELGSSGIFISGIPDAGSALVNLKKALYGAKEGQYKVLMSHAPYIAPKVEKGQFDLLVSGHTHGGQIFPFHFLAKQANGCLSGLCEINGNTLYVTRGAGYWGPPIRLFAPSDITLIKLEPAKND